MGKGDKKTAKGKRVMGSYGITRPKKKDSAVIVPDAKTEKPAKEKKEAAPKKETVKKPAAAKKAPAAKTEKTEE